MNPCPCGNFGSKDKECICSPINLARYQRKISGPIIDRIDLWMEVAKVEHERLMDKESGEEETEKVKKRILKARETQEKRFEKAGLDIKTNGEMSSRNLINLVVLKKEVKDLLDQSAKRLDLSARAYHRIIKVARTIADLENSKEILVPHILEAIQYRPKNIFSGNNF
jgi:magnesium chelatase family protein